MPDDTNTTNNKVPANTSDNTAPVPLSQPNAELFKLLKLIVFVIGIPVIAWTFQTQVSENTLLMIVALIALFASPDLLVSLPSLLSSAKKIRDK